MAKQRNLVHKFYREGKVVALGVEVGGVLAVCSGESIKFWYHKSTSQLVLQMTHLFVRNSGFDDSVASWAKFYKADKVVRVIVERECSLKKIKFGKPVIHDDKVDSERYLPF